jgi:NADH-quinone oxidoreductase subunit M
MDIPILTLLILVPLIGAALTFFLRGNSVKAAGALITAVTLVLSFITLSMYDSGNPNIQLIEYHQWIPSMGITYTLGADGLSVTMILLTALVSLAAILYAYGTNKRINHLFSLLLLTEAGLMGVFTAMDFFLFYVFWEIVLIPLYFVINIWGEKYRKYASIKFLIYTHVGSVIMILGLFAIYFLGGMDNFMMIEMLDDGTGKIINAETLGIPVNLIPFIFLAIFFGMAVKMALVPFHTWCPDAYVNAPTAGTIMLAALLSKMGAYGMIRICVMMFPATTVDYSFILLVFAAVTMVYGAVLALAQVDFKKLLAYSSISHVGYIMLGIAAVNAIGLQGAVFQMFNHGLVVGLLFIGIAVVKQNAGTRIIGELGGIVKKMPVLVSFIMVGIFATIGLPGLCTFVSEVLVFLGAFKAYFVFGLNIKTIIVLLSTVTILITIGYALFAAQRAFFGPYNEGLEAVQRVHEIDKNYILIPLVILASLIIITGLMPYLVLDILNKTVENIGTLLVR